MKNKNQFQDENKTERECGKEEEKSPTVGQTQIQLF
jgi:hypothetical protein